MIITITGIVLFELSEWIKFIKKRPVEQVRALLDGGHGVPYYCMCQRHDVPSWPIGSKAA